MGKFDFFCLKSTKGTPVEAFGPMSSQTVFMKAWTSIKIYLCLGFSPDIPHPLVDFQNTSGSHGPWEVNVNFGVLKIPPGFGGSGRSFPQKMPKLPYRSLQQYSPSVEIKNPLWSSGGVEQKNLKKTRFILSTPPTIRFSASAGPLRRFCLV